MSNQELIVFDPKAVATIGNKMLGAILTHELRKEEAEQVLEQANKNENFIDYELTKCAMFLHNEEKIDLHHVYGEKSQSSTLYRSILVEMGVLKRTITDDDRVVYSFEDEQLAGAYEFTQAIASYKHDPEKETKPSYTDDEVADHRARRARRNALNIRLARVCKAALTLIDAKADVTDLTYREKEDGTRVPTLTKGPKEVMGKSKEVTIATGNAAKVEGASASPTMSGLAKVSDAKYKSDTSAKAASKGEGANKQDAATSNEADFLALVNSTLQAVKKREGEFTKAEKQAMQNLAEVLKSAK